MADLPPGFTLDEPASDLPPGFSLDPPKAAAPKPSRIGSLARGIVQGATFGLADEARAKLDALRGVKSEEESLAQSRETLRQDMATNPTGAVMGQIAGGVGGALVGGAAAGALGFGRLVAGLGQINPLLGGVARITAGGAAGGAATAFGEAQGGLGPRADAALAGAAIGAGTGAAVHGAFGVANMLRNPIRPQLPPEALRIRNVARNEGIPMSVAQETGSPWLKNVEASLAQLPGSAGMEANAQRLQNEAFSRAAMRRAGENVDNATPPTLNAAADRSGGVIGRIANTYNLDASPPQFLDDLVRQADGARRYATSDVERQTVSRIYDILGKVEAGDTIPGQAYREMRSEIGATLRRTQDGDLIHHLRAVMNTLDDSFAAGLPPQEAAAFAEARRHYANLHVVADAMGGAGAQIARGQVSPLRLQGAVNRSTGGGYAWGQGDLNDLSRIGQDVLRNPPDSGTAGRAEANKMLTGSLSLGGAGAGFGIGGPVGAAIGAVSPYVLPSIAQRFMQSPAGRNWLINGLGQIDPALAGAAATATGSQMNRLLKQD